jgi:hypothetical protein
MDWYYAIKGKRIGPVSEVNFAQLVANDVIRDDTLVWHKGMAEWARWDVVAPASDLPLAARIATMPEFPMQAAPADEDASWTADEFWARSQQHIFATSVGGCFSRTWEVYKAAFWPCLGVTALAYLILMAVGFIPVVGLLSIFFVTPQVTAGAYWYFVLRIRGESPGLETLFTGFQQSFGTLAGLGVVQLVVAIVAFVPIGIIVASMGLMHNTETPPVGGLAVLGGGLGVALIASVLVVISLRLILAHIVVIDLGAGMMDALKLSWRIVGRKIWTMIGLMLLMFLLAIAGTLALVIGLLFVMPMFPAMLAQFYEDARNSARGQPPED